MLSLLFTLTTAWTTSYSEKGIFAQNWEACFNHYLSLPQLEKFQIIKFYLFGFYISYLEGVRKVS